VRGLFLFIYPALGVLFALVWFRPWGRALVPAALAVLAPLAAALMIAPPGLGPVLLVAALGLAAPALYGGRHEAAAATWRFFLLGVLGLLPLMAVAWLQSGGEGGAAGGGVLLVATLILLGGFPFHVWVRPLGQWLSPGALIVALGVLPAGVVAYLFGLLDAAPATRAAADFQSALRLSATLTALTAAFLMGRARHSRDRLGAALLLDGGFLLATALAPGAAGLSLALTALAGRFLSLLLIGLGLHLPPDGQQAHVFGRPIALRTVLVVFGLLSLAGAPLTPGFAARWAQMALLAPAAGGAGWLAWLPAAVLPLALAVATWAVWRAPVEPEGGDRPPVAAGPGERGAALLLLALAALLGLFPSLLAGYAARLLGA